jgi:hypothetical protein
MVTFIHCIENKKNHTFETDAKIYLDSFKHTNFDLFNSVDIHFLQPTPNNITQETVNYFANNNVKFTCVPTLSTKQINKEEIDQYIRFRNALMKDFELELLNNDYIETDKHLEVYKVIMNLSNEIRRLERNEKK